MEYLRDEQLDYVKRMELPVGTALNTALLENVFVMLVCILNKLPVFVVGKPGCSKSLSMQLINSNLRGKDSKDPFFQKLPQVYVVAYLCSHFLCDNLYVIRVLNPQRLMVFLKSLIRPTSTSNIILKGLFRSCYWMKLGLPKFQNTIL